MVIKEYSLKPEFFQEITVPVTASIINAVVKSAGEVMLLAEIDEDYRETQVYLNNELKNIGVYIVATNDLRGEDIPEDYRYLTTIRMTNGIEILLYHIYVKDEEYYLEDGEPVPNQYDIDWDVIEEI